MPRPEMRRESGAAALARAPAPISWMVRKRRRDWCPASSVTARGGASLREGPAPIPWDADAMPDEATDDSFVGGLPHGDQSRLARHRNSVEQLSAGIYGTVISSATMAAAASLPLGGVVLGGLTTILVYWVAEQYASGLAHHAVVGRVTVADVLRALRERFTMVEASFVPLLTVLAVGALGASV